MPLEKLIETGSFDFDRVAGSAAWIHEVEDRRVAGDELPADDDDDEHEHHEHEHDHEHHHHHHDHDHEEGEAEEYGISTFVYYARKPFNLSLFDNFVARHWPKEVIRAKGMCYFASEYDTCYVFEQAGRQFQLKNAGQWYATMPKDELLDLMEKEPALVRDWDEEYGDRMQKLVFIGQKMDTAATAKTTYRAYKTNKSNRSNRPNKKTPPSQEGTEKGRLFVEGSKKRKDCNGKTLQSFFVLLLQIKMLECAQMRSMRS